MHTLFDNPFHRLAAGLTDSEAAIRRAYAGLAPSSDEKCRQLRAARAQLLDPDARLAAEVSWFPHQPDPSALARRLATTPTARLPALCAQLRGIERANAAAAMRPQNLDDWNAMHELFMAGFDEYSSADLTERINAHRAAAGLPAAAPAAVDAAVAGLAARWAALLIDYLPVTGDEAGAVGACLVAHPPRSAMARRFAEALVERYRERHLAPLSQRLLGMQGLGESLQRLPPPPSPLDGLYDSLLQQLLDHLQAWAALWRPVWLLRRPEEETDGVSAALLAQLMRLVEHLAGPAEHPTAALKLAQGVQAAFQEAGPVDEALARSVAALRSSVGVSGHQTDLLSAIEQALAQPERTAAAVVREGFRARVEGAPGRLYRCFDAAARSAQGSPAAALPWLLLLSVPAALQSHGYAAAAARFLRDLRGYRGAPMPASVAARLEESAEELTEGPECLLGSATFRCAERGDLLAPRLEDGMVALMERLPWMVLACVGVAAMSYALAI